MNQRVRLDIPILTVVKLLGALLATVILIRLWPLLLLLFLSALLAVTLAPVVRYLRRLMPKAVAIPLVALVLFGSVSGVILFVGPQILDQTVSMAEKLPEYTHQLLGHFSENGILRNMGERMLKSPGHTDPMAYLGQAFVVGQFALGGLSSTVLVLVFAVYMVADGRRLYEWVLAFFSPRPRAKLEQTAEEVSRVIFAYVAGQLITSTACAIFVYVLLRSVGVEQALMLGVLAGILDVLPILGFIFTLVPAVIFAMAVSGEAAAITFAGFAVYHVVENYVIVPAVYGNRLRVSTLTVLISLLAGALLAGILGAIAILPVIASYPIIERIWLSKYLGTRVVRKHDAIDEAEHGPSEKHATHAPEAHA